MFNPALDNKSITGPVSSNPQIKVAGFHDVHVSFGFGHQRSCKESRLCYLVRSFRCVFVRQITIQLLISNINFLQDVQNSGSQSGSPWVPILFCWLVCIVLYFYSGGSYNNIKSYEISMVISQFDWSLDLKRFNLNLKTPKPNIKYEPHSSAFNFLIYVTFLICHFFSQCIFFIYISLYFSN